MEQSAAGGDNINDNKCNHKDTLINFHTIKVPKDDTIIEDETFFNVQELSVKDNRINNSGSYFYIDKEENRNGSIPESPNFGMHNPL